MSGDYVQDTLPGMELPSPRYWGYHVGEPDCPGCKIDRETGRTPDPGPYPDIFALQDRVDRLERLLAQLYATECTEQKENFIRHFTSPDPHTMQDNV